MSSDLYQPFDATSGNIHALGLLSGGLDSQLAVRLLQQQGIHVHGITFEHPFYDSAPAKEAAKSLSIPLRVYDFTDDILSLLQHAPHGFGKCMNPCIDCHASMLRRAGDLLKDEGCHFLFTGEVLNERPMSQTKRSLETVALESRYADLVLRPLSAQLLEPTLPEREGWVDRSRLLALSGRRRTAQFSLAQKLKLVSYPSPAGGCLLTDPHFCHRLKDLRDHEGLTQRQQVQRLRWGRHFRLSNQHKFILGRHAADNAQLEASLTKEDILLTLDGDRPGPSGLLSRKADCKTLEDAAAITATYGKCPPGEATGIALHYIEEAHTDVMTVRAMHPERIGPMRID